MIHTSFESILSSVEKNTVVKRAALVCAEDAHALHAVMDVYQKGLVKPVLIGSRSAIAATAKELGLEKEIEGLQSFEASSQPEAAQLGVKLVREGEADFLMKGGLETATLLKAVVDKEHGLSAGSVMSHVAINQIPSYHKLLVVTDGGMLPYPTLEQKKQIIGNAAAMMNRLGYDCPVVCVLAAAERVNPRMPETTDAAALKEMNLAGEISGCAVEGPISLDLALVKAKAQIKKYDSPYAGEADILLVPNIHAGNILGKSLVEMAGARMAGLVLGASCPIVLTSRGSSYEEKFYSLMLACVVSGKENN